MPKPEIVGSLRSTYTRVVAMVCEEKGIDYTLTEVPLHAPELFKVHPFGKMPVMRAGDVQLYESQAIALWLDATFPAPMVFPQEPLARALCEQWVSLTNSVIDRTIIRTYLFCYIAPGRMANPDRAGIEQVMPAVKGQLAVLDKAVADTGFLVGDAFTFADINLMPILHRLGQFPEGGPALAEAKNLAAYYKRHAERPSFTRTDPPSGPPKRAS
jgi:glutathione S-transferase